MCDTNKFKAKLKSKFKKGDNNNSSIRSKLLNTGDYATSGEDAKALEEVGEARLVGQQATKKQLPSKRKGKTSRFIIAKPYQLQVILKRHVHD